MDRSLDWPKGEVFFPMYDYLLVSPCLWSRISISSYIILLSASSHSASSQLFKSIDTMIHDRTQKLAIRANISITTALKDAIIPQSSIQRLAKSERVLWVEISEYVPELDYGEKKPSNDRRTTLARRSSQQPLG